MRRKRPYVPLLSAAVRVTPAIRAMVIVPVAGLITSRSLPLCGQTTMVFVPACQATPGPSAYALGLVHKRATNLVAQDRVLRSVHAFVSRSIISAKPPPSTYIF